MVETISNQSVDPEITDVLNNLVDNVIEKVEQEVDFHLSKNDERHMLREDKLGRQQDWTINCVHQKWYFSSSDNGG